MRYAAKADDNQPALVKHWRALGGSWFSTHRLPGELDGVAGACGTDVRVEIKDGNKPPSRQRLTEAERRTMSTWSGRPPVIWRTLDDVEATYLELRQEMKRRRNRALYRRQVDAFGSDLPGEDTGDGSKEI